MNYRRQELLTAALAIPGGAALIMLALSLPSRLFPVSVLLVLVGAIAAARGIDAAVFIWRILDDRAARVVEAELRRRSREAVLTEALAVVEEQGL